MEFRPGALWGRYEIVSRVAVGGMAEIYRARLRGPAGFRKEVALKRMRPEFSGEPGFRRMFESEASIAARLNHPNIVQAFELVELEDELALSMEFVSGGSLRKLLAEDRKWGNRKPDHRLSVWIATYVAWGAARALCHAWEARGESGAPLHLIHRDVSPDNLLLSSEGGVKLIDFGIARPLGEVSDPGMVKGKLLYMSPEQVLGGTLDARTDLYSLGIVLYESALGLRRPLFDAETESLTRVALLKRHVIPPARLDPDFPEELSHLIMKALERDPDRRFASAAAMVKALEEILDRHWQGRPFEAELARFLRLRQQALRASRHCTSTPQATHHGRRPRRLRVSRKGTASADQRCAGISSEARKSAPIEAVGRHRRRVHPSELWEEVHATGSERGLDAEKHGVRGGAVTPCDRGSSGASGMTPTPEASTVAPEEGVRVAVTPGEPCSRKRRPADLEHSMGRESAVTRRARRMGSRASPSVWRFVASRKRLSHRLGQRWQLHGKLPMAVHTGGSRPTWPRKAFLRLSELCLRNAPYLFALLATLLAFWSLSESVVRQETERRLVACDHAERPGCLARAPSLVCLDLLETSAPTELLECLGTADDLMLSPLEEASEAPAPSEVLGAEGLGFTEEGSEGTRDRRTAPEEK